LKKRGEEVLRLDFFSRRGGLKRAEIEKKLGARDQSTDSRRKKPLVRSPSLWNARFGCLRGGRSTDQKEGDATKFRTCNQLWFGKEKGKHCQNLRNFPREGPKRKERIRRDKSGKKPGEEAVSQVREAWREECDVGIGGEKTSAQIPKEK